MKRTPKIRELRPEEARLWAVIAATVRPAHGRGAERPKPETEVLPHTPPSAPEPPAPPRFTGRMKPKGPAPREHPPQQAQTTSLHAIEPNRRRRIIGEREVLDRRLDLHGLDQDKARAVLFSFLMNAHREGVRAVLVITGKGLQGDGVLRRRTPEWLADPALRSVVAGVSVAERHHGGEGALYVALKRRA